MKKAIVMLLSVLMVFSMIPTFAFAANADVTLTVEASKTEVSMNEEVTFSVYIETAIPFTTIQFDVAAPAGMDYVANSGKVPDGLKAQMGFAEASFTELTKRVTYGNDLPYTANGKLKVAEFKCKATAANAYTVTVDGVDVCNADFDSLSYDVVGADVAVVVKATGVTLDKETVSINAGATETLVATVAPAEATNKTVTWTSSDETVATVANGVVTGVKEGTATITVKTADGNFTDTCVVTVSCAHANTTDVPAAESTCIKPGHAAYVKCDDCNKVISGSDADLPLVDHKWETTGEQTKPATCQEKGETTYDCTVDGCNAKDVRKDIPVDPNGHKLDEEGVVTEEPTCSAKGKTTYFCVNGDCKYSVEVENIDIDPDAHTYGEWNVTDEPSLDKEGKRTATCVDCNTPITEDMPKLTTSVSGDKIVAVDDNGKEIELDAKFELTDENDTLNGYTEGAIIEISDFEGIDKVEGKEWLVAYYSVLVDADVEEVVAGKTVKVSIKLNANTIADYENLAVYTADLLDDDAIAAFADAEIVDGYLVFTMSTDDLAQYPVLIAGTKKAVVEEDKNPGSEGNDKNESPKTGESSAAALAIVVFAIAASVVVITKKRVNA